MSESDQTQPFDTEFRQAWIEESCALSQYLADEFLSKAKFYLKTIEEFIATSRAAEIAALQKEADDLSPPRRPDYWSWHYPIHWEEIFEAQLRSSFVVTLASFVEDYLKTICEEVAVIERMNEKPRDWGTRVIQRARNFLREERGFPEPGEQSWSFLRNLYLLRNALVHGGGNIHKTRAASTLQHFIAEEADVSEEHGFARLGPGFCFRALTIVSQTVAALQSQQSALCQEAKERHSVNGPGADKPVAPESIGGWDR